MKSIIIPGPECAKNLCHVYRPSAKDSAPPPQSARSANSEAPQFSYGLCAQNRPPEFNALQFDVRRNFSQKDEDVLAVDPLLSAEITKMAALGISVSPSTGDEKKRRVIR